MLLAVGGAQPSTPDTSCGKQCEMGPSPQKAHGIFIKYGIMARLAMWDAANICAQLRPRSGLTDRQDRVVNFSAKELDVGRQPVYNTACRKEK